MNIRSLYTITLLTLILFTAFFIRIQGTPNIPFRHGNLLWVAQLSFKLQTLGVSNICDYSKT